MNRFERCSLRNPNSGGRAPGAPSRIILVFVREPARGMVKTRLAAEIGEAAALEVYRTLAQRAVDAARSFVPAVQLRVLFTPRRGEAAVRQWLGSPAGYRFQGSGSLGDRLHRGFSDAFCEGFREVVVIGSDLPSVSSATLAAGFSGLRDAEASIGPAADGGYYLLGLRTLVPGIFRDIPWSTPAVFGETRERLRAGGVEPALLPMMQDVDVASDLPPGMANVVTH